MTGNWQLVCVCALTGLSLSCGAGFRDRMSEDNFDGPIGPDDCYDLKDEGNPWVVEVPASSRSRLRADIEAGILLIQYDECHGARLLPQCVLKEKYGPPVDGGREKDKIFMNSRLDLFLNLPMGFASLKSNFKKGRAWRFDHVAVSLRDAPREYRPSRAEVISLGSECAKATHYVSSVALGAFFIGSYDAKEGSARLGVDLNAWRPEVGGEGSATRRFEKGSPQNFFACLDRKTPMTDSRCKTPLRFYLRKLPTPELPHPSPTVSPTTQVDRGASEKALDSAHEPKEMTLADAIWVKIEGGKFLMGSNDGEKDEKPPHWVTVPSFEMLKTEVTVDQYKACRGCSEPKNKSHEESCNWGYGDRGRHPVNCVDWEQARAFCMSIGGRLPTEAEWEYAARSGGQARKYPWGDQTVTCDYAIMAGTWSHGCGEYRTWPVCSKTQGTTDQGLCDMAGNVYEWVEDWYHDGYRGAPVDGSAWISGGGENRVLRGGSWLDRHLRTAERHGPILRIINYHVGFRCVRSLR